MTSAWRDLHAQAGRRLLLAVAGETVVGTLDTLVAPNLTHGARPYMVVENVVVAAGWRRRGVARALMLAALDDAAAAGCYKVQLVSNATRTDAIASTRPSGSRSPPSATAGISPPRPDTWRLRVPSSYSASSCSSVSSARTSAASRFPASASRRSSPTSARSAANSTSWSAASLSPRSARRRSSSTSPSSLASSTSWAAASALPSSAS
ncbi:GNAT family N-acetyltransferase [Micromonospora sp. NPDC048835]|uniref:GNAT family N-acetyltransferase n=1 Tax=Micromonospora sp. NPDC048835 TaxID=3155147 RepID=UPI0033C2AA4F